MNKSLSDLKRDLKLGTKVILLERFGKQVNEEREVGKVQSNSIAFKKGNGLSWLDYPKASLLSYDGNTFTIYEAGYRDLTEHEQSVLNNRPSKRPENRERVEQEVLTDGSSFYYQDKAYFKNLDMQYLDGFEEVRGLRLDKNNQKIRDNSIKGAVILKYKIVA